MSTNFYMSSDGKEETIHLGKCSAGWTFLFKGSDTVTDLRSWYANAKKLESQGYKLINDNGSDITTLKALLVEIKNINNLKQHTTHEHMWTDHAGNCFCDLEFL